MKKLFVSVPMHGRKLDEINGDIRKAVDAFINWNEEHEAYTDDVEFVDNLDVEVLDHVVKNERIWYLGKALEKLADCDGIIFCYGYREANGCMVERVVADKYGLDIFITTENGNMF